MNRVRTIRIAAGGLVGLAIVGAAAFGAMRPWPGISQQGIGSSAVIPSVEVTPGPSETLLACGGPIVALGRDAADPSGLSHVADLDVKARNGVPDDPEPGPDLQLEDVGAAPSFVQQPLDGTSVSVAAAGSVSLAEPDLAGFAASSCRAASPEAWLVGASVATGVTDIVTISNPTEVAATVSLAVFGVDGMSTPPNGELALAPHQQVAVPVASVAGQEQSPVIRVTAEGAPVVASLQSSRVVALDAFGLDLQSGTLPATESVIPHLTVTSAAADAGEDPTQVRVMGTTADSGSVVVDVVDESSGETAFSTTVDLAPEVPVAVGFDGLAEGSYAIRLSGDVPFVAAARQAAGRDYAWITPGDPLDGESLIALPTSPTGGFELGVAALGGDPAVVRVETVSGDDSQTIELEPGRSTSVDAVDRTTYRIIVENGRIAASASVTTDDEIGSIPAYADPAAPDPITVVP